MPSVWIRPDQSSFMLMITYGFETNKSYTHNVTNKVSVGNWVNLKISQMNGIQEIKVDYKLVHRKANYLPKSWTNVNVIMGNTGIGNLSTVVHYRNFEISTCKTKGKPFFRECKF